MPDEIYLTKEGFEKLKKELEFLKGQKRKEIAEALQKARALGDLSENAEYDSAKQAQAINEKRIMELELKLATAKILDDTISSTDKIYIGSSVKLLDITSKEELVYKLVPEDEADFSAGKISVSSPVGKALLGLKKGDIASIKVPVGVLRYKVIDIS